MTSEGLSVRQWQELYRAGAFAQDDRDTRKLAGWDDFYHPLDDRKVQALAKLVMDITHPFILDEYRVYFVEHWPGQGPKYSSVCFDPLKGKWSERMFSIDLDCPFERGKWSLHTRRYGEGEPEFECGHIRRMLRYIHTMAHELENDINPPFWPEMKAAQQFAFECSCYFGTLRREGEHSYSYWDRRSYNWKVLHVARNLEDLPPEVRAAGSREINGLYVYCPEDVGVPLMEHPKNIKKSPKKKGLTR